MRSLKDHVVDVPDFPKSGVLFRDITPILSSPELMAQACRQMLEPVRLSEIDLIAGIESRGFILGSALASISGKGFIPVRKAGKLPPPVVGRDYDLEYGRARLEMKRGQGRILIVDDVLATGGTLQAAIDVCRDAGYTVVDVGVLINLSFLNRMTFNGRAVPAPIHY